MKRKHPNTIPMEEMTQDLLDKAYSCEMSKEQLLKMFSDCIEKKWMEEEEKFRKKVEVYLQKNQGNIESYEADFMILDLDMKMLEISIQNSRLNSI